VIWIRRVMLVVGSSSWLTLCTMPPPACTFIGLMTVPLMMGCLVLGSTAEELTVSASEDSLQQQQQQQHMRRTTCIWIVDMYHAT
jgi:hypothetical protein